MSSRLVTGSNLGLREPIEKRYFDPKPQANLRNQHCQETGNRIDTMQPTVPHASSPELGPQSVREQLWLRLGREVFDIAIVGGGINGAVAAAAASAAGLRVALLEKKDFASSTSQESSNLVWGGIKYLESYEFGLVWDLCRSRNELMEHYPHQVKEVRFFTHLERGFRKPRFMVYLGTWLYWLMGRFQTRAPRLLSCADIAREEPIVATDRSQGGFEYSDCYLADNDARFVFRFIKQALQSGSCALNYAAVRAAHRAQDQLWHIQVDDHPGARSQSLRARVLINAAGPYADQVNQLCAVKSQFRHIFSKGVHLIVRRLTTSDRVLTFFADDGRLFFVIPMGTCSCIGTTDTREKSLPPKVEPADRQFILDNINKRLKLTPPLTEADVISERCGVRPLVVQGGEAEREQRDWVQLSRKHEIEVHSELSQISIFGGKLTDCLNIGRELLVALRRLGLVFQAPSSWFGEGSTLARKAFLDEFVRLGLPNPLTPGEGTLADRLWRNYGEDAPSILLFMQQDFELQQPVVAGAPVILAEAAYMARAEMVVDLEDFLRRRTRLSLVVRHETLAQSPNLYRACQLLFGHRADDQWQRYFKSRIPA